MLLDNFTLQCSSSTTSGGCTPLMALVLLTREFPELNDIIRKYCKKDINKQNDEGWTALMMAARNSNTDSTLDTVKILLEAGADPNLQEKDGWTALKCAARYSNTDSSLNTVKLLLEAGADVNIKTKNDWTVLMSAARYSNTDSSLDTVKLLLEAGANPKLLNNVEHSALDLADDESTKDLIKNFKPKVSWKNHKILNEATQKNLFYLHLINKQLNNIFYKDIFDEICLHLNE